MEKKIGLEEISEDISSGNPEKDPKVLEATAEVGAGERCLLGD